MTLNDLENNAIGVLATMRERTPESVRTVLAALLALSADLKAQTSDEQLELCAQRIETKLFVRVNDASSIELDREFKKWLPQRRAEVEGHFYYPRYRRWLSQKGFVSNVLGVLDKDTDKIVGLLGDPLVAKPWSRRGLVVGHVQSGKTANYSGVIRAREEDEMPAFDVCLFSPAKTDAGTCSFGSRTVRLQERATNWDEADDGVQYFRVNGKSSRVASRGQEKVGLSEGEAKKARDEFFDIPSNKGRNVPDIFYRVHRSRPLLMLHLLKLVDSDEGSACTETDVLAWGISFKSTQRPEQQVEYVVNTTWWKSNFQEDLEEAAEESEQADA